MADIPWWATVVSTVVGSMIPAVFNFLGDFQRARTAAKQKQADQIAAQKKEEGKQDGYWRKEANNLLGLKAVTEHAETAGALCDSLKDIKTFILSNQALLRMSGNRDFFFKYCSEHLLRQLEEKRFDASLHGHNSENRDGDFQLLKERVRKDLANLVVPRLEDLKRLEEKERQETAQSLQRLGR